ncbi:MAG: GYF domain-containing protein [Methylovirgula sp.]
MAERSWYIVNAGRQEGPFPETEFLALVAAGRVTADTLVWSEGMADWQRAGDVPGLIAAAAAPPPPGPPPTPLPGSAQWPAANTDSIRMLGNAVTADFGVWGLLGRALLAAIGTLLVIPAPWAMTSFYKWFIEHLRVPQIPALGFSGKPGDIWWVFILIGLFSYAGLPETRAHPEHHVHALPILLVPVEAALGWFVLRWLISNITSSGRPLGLRFNGDILAYVGWSLLFYISFITIIGWAWVTSAWMRWIAANIAGTPGPVTFNATGLEILWRTFVVALGCAFIIPIPWVVHWYARWYVSQFSVAGRA